MKKSKKFILFGIGMVLIVICFGLTIFLVQSKIYRVYIDTSKDENFYLVNTKGIIVNGLFKDTFTLATDYTYLEDYSVSKDYGQVLFIGSNKENRELLEGFSAGTIFNNVEYIGREGNIVNKILKNKDDIYLCFFDNKTISDLEKFDEENSTCFKLNIKLV